MQNTKRFILSTLALLTLSAFASSARADSDPDGVLPLTVETTSTRVFIDEIEDDNARVLYDNDSTPYVLPVDMLPSGAHEGQTFTLTLSR
jgi:hypothetical protein